MKGTQTAQRMLMMVVLSLLWNTAAAGAIRMAVPDDTYPPYVEKDAEDRVLGGRLIAPFRAALADLGLELQLQSLPVLRSTHMLSAGQLDARMESSQWVAHPERFLWLDLGIWLEDVLLYRADLPFRPDALDMLEGTEVIAHMGYVYPQLDPLFGAGRLSRLDKYSEESMIDALLQAPAESPRLMVMERGVWEWYASRVTIPPYIRVQQSALVVGCAPLQIQLADTERMRALLPALQAAVNRHTSQRERPSSCR